MPNGEWEPLDNRIELHKMMAMREKILSALRSRIEGMLDAGWNQVQIADELEVHQSTVSRIIRGESRLGKKGKFLAKKFSVEDQHANHS